MTHAEAISLVRGSNNRDSRKVGNNTYARILNNGSVAIRLHSTDVVTIHEDNTATLNTDGWQTVTTKKRINEYSPIKIYQKAREWYLSDGRDFQDGMLVGG
jgi:hypothetical protein